MASVNYKDSSSTIRIHGRFPLDWLDAREDRLREQQFVTVPHGYEWYPVRKSAGWDALEASRAHAEALKAAEEAGAEALKAANDLADRIAGACGGDPVPGFWVEVELEAPYAPAVWLHGVESKIRVPLLESDLAEIVRVASFLTCVPYWAASTAHNPAGRPVDSWDVVVPYGKAKDEEATHVLLYDAATDRCIGHVPPRLACDEAIEAAQKIWDEVEDSWQRVTPAWPRSPWSAESPVTPDTPESAGSAE